MRVFKLSRRLEVVCRWEKTRYGFRHLATVLLNGCELDTNKACYYNRTWERYEYQTVLRGAIEKCKALTAREQKAALLKIEKKLS